MQINQTVRKIEKILKSKFSTNDYMDLIREIFPTVKIISPDRFHKEYTNFSSHIEGSIHVGNYTDPDGKKLIIHAVQLVKESYVENSRSTQRSYAKKLMEAGNADAAIIAFYTEGDPKWRLSYVRLDYEIKFENGKLNTTENMTPAKRYSYLVGEDEPSHTAISRFYRFITDDPNTAQPTLDDLEEAFSVEKVTDEFFQLYCEKFHELREALESNPDFVLEAEQHNFTSEQFAKKLMGQIVFLYFLQKKGWLGVKAWPRELDEKGYKNAFFSRGAKSRELIPKVYVKVEDNRYLLSGKALKSLSDDDECVLATCVKGQPWGSGSQLFMRELFEFSQKRKANFFDDFLEPLFYDALNVNRGEQGYDPALHCRIPFLSGGLFEPIDGYDWKHNDFAIPNAVFSNKAEKGERDADGILDIFDRYNFTMSEDEPLEREVAIDPEMLGKVFENLLEVRDRKSKGAFYTPREIVHYMCQETLISYLIKKTGLKEQDVRDFILLGDFLKDVDTAKDRRHGDHDMLISEEIFKIDKNGDVVVDRLKDIDNALANIRVADPAVGSGAFPLGMLNEIVRARQNISAYMAITMNSYEKRMMYNNERSPYTLKAQTIKNCIYAADIEPSAVDIAQLRLWLSLVIDDEINPNAQSPLDGHRNPIPLPNLECNILCGNSLIDEFEGFPLINHNDTINTNVGAQQNLFQNTFDAVLPSLLKAQDSLFNCEDTVKKQELKEAIESLKDEIVKSQMIMASSKTWERYLNARRQASRPFVLWQIDFARVFREKGGFDIVIGNPPYVGEKGNKELFRPIAATQFGHRFYCGKMDLFYFFFHKAIDLGNENAEISFITTNYYPTAFGGKILRKDFKKRTQIRRLINLHEMKVFESAMGQHNLITMLTKSKTPSIAAKNCLCKLTGFADSNLLRQVLYSVDKPNDYMDRFIVNQEDLYEGEELYIRISGCGAVEGESINSILSKISNTPFLLKTIANIKQGIVSGADKYTDAHEAKFGLGFPKGKGIFVLRKSELMGLGLDNVEKKKYVRPVYKNGQVSKYHIDYDDSLWVLYMTKDTVVSEVPNILVYLEQFRPLLEQRLVTYNESYPWFALHRERDKTILDAPEKIVNSRRALSNTFAMETKHYFEQSDMMVTVIKKQYMKDFPAKYVLGVLNSKLFYLWLRNRGKVKGKMLELYGKPLEEIPIKQPTDSIKASIVDAVSEILDCDGIDREIVRHNMEVIDQNLYELYGLTAKEIDIVEEFVNNS